MDIFTLVTTYPDGDKDIFSVTRLETALEKLGDMLYALDIEVEIEELLASLEECNCYKLEHRDGIAFEILQSFID